MINIYPILLAGGSGTRLWPLSRKSYPKQFSKLIGDTTLFQNSAIRLTSSKLVKFAPHITLTNTDFRFIVGEQLQALGLDPGPILIEPEAKNTAAAILAASVFALKEDKNAVLLVAPSDHIMPDTHAFHQAISVGLSHVSDGKIVTFGIQPTYPETGYGYLETSGEDLDIFGVSKLSKFVEKPNLKSAEHMITAGNYHWNAGIFLFRAQDMIDAFANLATDTLELVSAAVDNATPDLGFLRLAEEPWTRLSNISIDYAIMEKVDNLVCVPYHSKWSDLGSWDAVWSEGVPDKYGNVTSKTAHAINCTNSLLRAENSEQHLVGIDLNNIIAIAMPDAVLVAQRHNAQSVKEVVEFLKIKNISQSEVFPKDHRPWGWFESLALGERFQVKKICVKPGEALSLQSHNFRSEHWIVVEGTATVTIHDATISLTEGQSVYIPLGATHRLENLGKSPMVLIEVQTGEYLGEDDITRYEDRYNRGENSAKQD